MGFPRAPGKPVNTMTALGHDEAQTSEHKSAPPKADDRKIIGENQGIPEELQRKLARFWESQEPSQALFVLYAAGEGKSESAS